MTHLKETMQNMQILSKYGKLLMQNKKNYIKKFLETFQKKYMILHWQNKNK